MAEYQLRLVSQSPGRKLLSVVFVVQCLPVFVAAVVAVVVAATVVVVRNTVAGTVVVVVVVYTVIAIAEHLERLL